MLVLLLLSFVAYSVAIPIDNGVVGIPQVSCEDTQVTMIFNTQRPFTGRIFVKGLSDTQECLQSYRANSGNSVIFQLKAGQCNMRRQRRLGPQRGVETSMTVILSFHDTFITKVDKAYRLDVSVLPTTDLFDTARMPSCKYTVRSGSINGPIVQYARVGEPLYHVWDCDSDMFGMLVHSCFVDDGNGQQKFPLLDNKGCAIDPVILGDLTYGQGLNQAYVESHAFKFADKVTTYFQCALSLCMKSDGACVGLTPPNCNRGSRARFRRGLRDIIATVPNAIEPNTTRVGEDMDIAAEKIYILELDDDLSSGASAQNLPVIGRIPPPVPTAKRDDSASVCLSAQGLGFMFATFSLITATAVSATVFMCLRRRQEIANVKA